MARRSDRGTLADQLRAAIKDSNLTNYALGADAQVPEATIWRFRKGERDITLDTAGRIAAVLGLELVATRRSKARETKRPRSAGPGPLRRVSDAEETEET